MDRTQPMSAQDSDQASDDLPEADACDLERQTIPMAAEDITRADDAYADPPSQISTDPLSSQYAILETIGHGGMGTVYLARDHKLLRHVAIKRLNRAVQRSATAKERFWQEAKAVAALNHIHIVHIYSLSEDEEGPYIVMEYVPGPAAASPNKTPPAPFNLADRVNRDGPLPLHDALDVMKKVCRAVEHAHSCGVIHRDLKPANILFDESSEPKIVDFGLARRISPEQLRLTSPGDRMLSLGYGAPEQEADASTSDERADVYGLGALLYFSITGKNPRYFRQDDVPDALRMSIVKALETDKKHRWASVKEFAETLERVGQPDAVVVPTGKTTWRCRWCDTVNPLAVQFCGKCGWDGAASCLECGTQMRIGVQFCGDCGADAREYETASRLLEQLKERFEETAFEHIVHRANSIGTFRPAGPNGQRIVGEVNSLLASAQKAVKRRSQLKARIEQNLAAGNHESARTQVREYNTLAKDLLFDDAIAEMSNPALENALDEARKLIMGEDWQAAIGVCKRALAEIDPANGEATILLRRAQRRMRRRRIVSLAAVSMCLFLLYLLSGAPTYRALGRPTSGAWQSIYAPMAFVQHTTLLQVPLERYAVLWGVPNMCRPRPTAPKPVAPMMPPTPEPRTVEELAKLGAEHAKRLASIDADAGDWATRYSRELTVLLQRMQAAGDYEGWVATKAEIERFETKATIPEQESVLAPLPAELAALRRDHYRRMTEHAKGKTEAKLRACRSYIEHLTNMQTNLTKRGQMENAALVNSEIIRIETAAATFKRALGLTTTPPDAAP